MEDPQDVDEALPRDVKCALGSELNVLISGGDQHIRITLARMIWEANKTRQAPSIRSRGYTPAGSADFSFQRRHAAHRRGGGAEPARAS